MDGFTEKEMAEIIEKCGGMEEIMAGFARFKRDTDYFEAHFAELLKKYPNKWVAVHGAKVVGTSKDLSRLLSRLRKKGVPTNETVIHFLNPNPKPLILLQIGATSVAPISLTFLYKFIIIYH